MQKYGVNELRKMFLEFFESKGHLAMKSFSLVPHNDKSLLFINFCESPVEAILHRAGETAETESYHLSEVYSYGRY